MDVLAVNNEREVKKLESIFLTRLYFLRPEQCNLHNP